MWRVRDFRLVWGGSLITGIGDWLLLVGLPVYVFTASGSGVATAAVFVVEVTVAVLLGPIGGSLVDRWDLRRTLIWTNVLHAVTLLPLLTVSAHRVWPAYIVIGVQAALTQVNRPARMALTPRVVAPEQLVPANAAGATAQSIARLIGSPLGGIAVAFGGLSTVVIADGISFAVVAIASWAIRTRTPPAKHDDGHAATGVGVRAGLAEIRRRPTLKMIVIILGIGQVAQGLFLVLFVVFVVERLDGGGTQVGIIRGSMAVGGIVGAYLITRVAQRISAARLIVVGYLGMGIASWVFWNAPTVSSAVWLAMVLFALSGLPGAAMGVGLETLVQQRSPRDLLGRVTGVLGAADAIGGALGATAAGLLLHHVSLVALLDAQAAIYVCCGVLFQVLIAGRERSELPALELVE